MTTLQEQGVPIPSNIPVGTYASDTPAKRTRAARSPAQTARTSRAARQSFGTNVSKARQYSPTTLGDKGGSNVGLLEAEFFGALILLILLMFAGTDTYSSKVMSTMKRGTLVCVLFFILAMVAAIGPNMARVSKGLGALVVVTILLTTPVTDLFGDVDNLIKNDWVSTGETGTDVGSADTGTSGSSSGGTLGAAAGALNRIKGIINGFGIIP